jgi:hypothetical protein
LNFNRHDNISTVISWNYTDTKEKEGYFMDETTQKIIQEALQQTSIYPPVIQKAPPPTSIQPPVPTKGYRDVVEVFLYTNLATMISPNPLVLLTPSVRAALVQDINLLTGGYRFPNDLQAILNAWVLTNINQVSVSTRVGNAIVSAKMAAAAPL